MRILIVDDSEFFHPQIEALLAQGGYTDLTFASSAHQALELLANGRPPGAGASKPSARSRDPEDPDAHGPAFDLVLMDIIMPEVDGIEAIRRLKADPVNHDLPVMVITADTSPETLREAFDAGAIDHITKPINPVELLARVRSILRLKSEHDRRRTQEVGLKALNAKLAAAHERMTREMENAGRIQASLLPRQSPLVRGLSVDALYRPSGQASGDYYDHFPVTGNTVRLVVADVSGHGAGAAVLMAIVRTLMRSTRQRFLPLEETLGQVNEHLLETVGERPDYVSMLAADLDLEAGTLAWINAGHPPGLFRNGGGAVQRLGPATPPLGIRPLDFVPRSVSARSGRLLFYTDGFYEFHTAPGQWFSLEPFLTVAEELMDREVSPLGELERRVLDLTVDLSPGAGPGRSDGRPGGRPDSPEDGLDSAVREYGTGSVGGESEARDQAGRRVFDDDLTALWAAWGRREEGAGA